MDKPVTSENKKQRRQKPFRSPGRIAGEILAGTALGFVALLAVHVTGIVVVDEGCYEMFGFQAIFVIVFPPLNGLGTAVGVYLVGSRGNETGSLLLTFAGGFLGGLVATFFALFLFWGGIELILVAPVLLVPSILATYGFDLTRKYKETPSVC